MARRVDNNVIPFFRLEKDPGRVYCDALSLLILERVEQKGVFKRLRVALAVVSRTA